MMIKKGDIFTAYRENHPSENVMAIMDYEEGLLLHCVNWDGQKLHVGKHEIGQKICNIYKL